MKLQIRATAEGAELDIIQPGQGSGVEDKVLNTVPVAAGYQVDVNLPTATVIEQIEVGEAASSGGVDTPAEPPAGGGEGEGGGAPAGDGGGTPEEPPTTSAASEKPLYLVEGDTIPGGFSESGLETPDGKTLFHFGSDTAGQHSTGNVDGVSIYAEADDNEQPVQAAQPAEPAA